MKLAYSFLLLITVLNYQSSSVERQSSQKLNQAISVELDAIRLDKGHIFGLGFEHQKARSSKLLRTYDAVGVDSHGCFIFGERRSRFRKELPDMDSLPAINGPGMARKLLGPAISVRYGVEKSLRESDLDEMRNCEYDVCHVWRCFTVKDNCIHAVEIEMWFRLNFKVKANLEHSLLSELQNLEHTDERVRCTGVCIYRGVSAPLAEEAKKSILECQVNEDSPPPRDIEPHPHRPKKS